MARSDPKSPTPNDQLICTQVALITLLFDFLMITYHFSLRSLALILLALISSVAVAQTRLKQLIIDTDTCHYTYDEQGRLSRIDVGLEPIYVKHHSNKTELTYDTTFLNIAVNHDAAKQRTQTLTYTLKVADTHQYTLQMPCQYDAQGRLEVMGEDTLTYRNGQLAAFGADYTALSYEADLSPEVQRLVKAIPNFLMFLRQLDEVWGKFVAPVLRFSGELNVCPSSAMGLVAMPTDELSEPDADGGADPFLDIIDARTQRLMDIEAIRSSMQVEQAISESALSEERWLTLEQYGELEAEARRLYAEMEQGGEEEFGQISMTPLTNQRLRYTYTPFTTPQGLHALRVNIAVDADKPTDMRYQRTLTFVLE